MAHLTSTLQVSNCGMSDAIGPVHVKERPSIEMQSRIDAEVLFHRPLNYSDNIMPVLFHLAIHLGRSVYIFWANGSSCLMLVPFSSVCIN
jgi:hypothetical protein